MADDRSDEPRIRFEKSSADEFIEGTVRGKHTVLVDERDRGPPVGSGEDLHPTPVDYMLSSLVACQVAVLTQCLAKSRVEEFEIEATASVGRSGEGDVPDEMPENTATRIEHVEVALDLTVPEEYESRADRCLEVYDRGCIVGQSFDAGVEYEPETSLSVSD